MDMDFDFFHGSWDVVNRRLVKRLVGSTEWEEFPATSVCHGFFDGAGNFDEITFHTKGFSGATMRIFDPGRKEWSIYWANSRTGTLDPPVVGHFTDGVGTFYGDDTVLSPPPTQGSPIRVRFIWSEITPTSAKWEQAFSVLSPHPSALRAAGAEGPPPTDGEQNWETNWTMEFTRRAPA
jgi:hypothetical protein